MKEKMFSVGSCRSILTPVYRLAMDLNTGSAEDHLSYSGASSTWIELNTEIMST